MEQNRNDTDIDFAIIFKTIDDVIEMQIELLKMRTDDLIEPDTFRMKDFIGSNPCASEILKKGIKIKGLWLNA